MEQCSNHFEDAETSSRSEEPRDVGEQGNPYNPVSQETDTYDAAYWVGRAQLGPEVHGPVL